MSDPGTGQETPLAPAAIDKLIHEPDEVRISSSSCGGPA